MGLPYSWCSVFAVQKLLTHNQYLCALMSHKGCPLISAMLMKTVCFMHFTYFAKCESLAWEQVALVMKTMKTKLWIKCIRSIYVCTSDKCHMQCEWSGCNELPLVPELVKCSYSEGYTSAYTFKLKVTSPRNKIICCQRDNGMVLHDWLKRGFFLCIRKKSQIHIRLVFASLHQFITTSSFFYLAVWPYHAAVVSKLAKLSNSCHFGSALHVTKN